MRTIRPRQRGFFDARRVTLGDYIVLAAALVTFISLFLPWYVSNIPGTGDVWAFTYSEAASVAVIVLFLATVILALYPAVTGNTRLPPLPFSSPPVYLCIGIVLVLLFDYQLGKYTGIPPTGTGSTRGFGIWLGLIASLAYIVGAIIRWSTRPVRAA